MDTFLHDATATVLNNTSDKLVVLSHRKHRISTKTNKFSVSKQIQINTSTRGEINTSNLPVDALNTIKQNNDLKSLIDIYLQTISELQSRGNFRALLTTISQEQEDNKKVKELIKENNVSKSTLNMLKTRLSKFKSEADAKLLQASETLNNLKSDWRIISKINNLECDLVKKWEHTRYTQATIVGNRNEEILRKKLTSLIAKKEAEERVKFDFQTFSKLQLEKYIALIKMWKERYSEELNVLLENISEKEIKIKEVNTTYEKYHEIYLKHQKFVTEYLAQKAEQDRFLEQQIRRIESAIKIQAWWRGTMVRRCLGPFRKKPKKGKKGKKATK